MKTPKFQRSDYAIIILISLLLIWLVWIGVNTAPAETHMSINNFPSSDSVIHEDDINKDITFNFTVCNDGGRTTHAYISVMDPGNENKVQYSGPRAFGPGNIIKLSDSEIAIGKQFIFSSGETKEITAIIPAPNEVTTKEIIVRIDYDDKSKKTESNVITVSWG